ncbi:MAG TPA: peptide deformylase [Polyangia bacterium]|jgi:peptide deformylase
MPARVDPRLVAVVTLAVACGCASARYALNPEEHERLSRGKGPMSIVMYDPAQPDPTSVLRQRAVPVSPEDPDLTALVERMNTTLTREGGVGLAAPQIGVSRRVVLVVHGTRPKGQPTRVELYLNPRVDWASPEQDDDYEACLSIAGIGGLVPRAKRIKVSYDPLGGGPRRVIELTDWDARVMQHEIDHLDGVLFLDKLKGKPLPMDEMRMLRDAGHRARGWLPPAAPATAPAAPRTE